MRRRIQEHEWWWELERREHRPALQSIDPQTPATLYAAPLGAGVSKSTNDGEGWSAVNAGLPNLYVTALAIDPQISATLYAGSDSGLFKSTNGGESWSALPLKNLWDLVIDPVTPTTLYAGIELGGVYKSTNGGGSWSAVDTGLPSHYPPAYHDY